MYKILIVEDDINISEMVTDYLSGEGYEVYQFIPGESAISALEQESYDLALIDLMLPGCSGFDVVKSIRKKSVMPVIIITAKDNDIDKTRGLNLGADDYVTKPFSIIELVARIKANIRRATKYNKCHHIEEEIIQIKDLKIYTDQHKVERGGKIINLTHTEFEILVLLASNPGRAFSKEENVFEEQVKKICGVAERLRHEWESPASAVCIQKIEQIAEEMTETRKNAANY